jgi:hypothetical protein
MAITLGLGVIFESIDKGLEKDLNTINKQLNAAKKNTKEFMDAQMQTSRQLLMELRKRKATKTS